MNNNDDNDLDSNEEKILQTMMCLHKYFAQYVRESDSELFARAIDYAKTFTEQDIPGIKLNYVKDEVDEK